MAKASSARHPTRSCGSGSTGWSSTFHTEIALSPALFLHMRLLAQVVGEFYESKRREAVMRRNAYLQAVHETGARLTHDIKNLLQSLYALTSTAPREGTPGPGLREPAAAPASAAHQAPAVHARPAALAAGGDARVVAARAGLVGRRRAPARRRRLELEANIDGDAAVPANLFDAFLDNCLDNARGKGGCAGRIKASLTVSGGAPNSRSRTTATPCRPPWNGSSFASRSRTRPGQGLGIGLYQVARLAAQSGYAVELAHNEPGRVVFRLRPA